MAKHKTVIGGLELNFFSFSILKKKSGNAICNCQKSKPQQINGNREWPTKIHKRHTHTIGMDREKKMCRENNR